MTTSSPQTTCWVGSTDYATSCISDISTVTLSGLSGNYASSDTITFSNTSSNMYSYGSGNTITVSGASCIPTLTTTQLNAISGNGISFHTSEYKINFPEEWVNCFPDFDRIEKMCEEYPGLKIALEKFKTVYKLVKDHYDTPEDQRPRP